MEASTDEIGDTEDVPSDFFDDFTSEDFIDGLSVVDSWNDNKKIIENEDVKSVEKEKDLRDILNESKDRNTSRKLNLDHNSPKRDSSIRRSTSSSHLNDFIKPGSRRDPNKTNEAIRKDKEEKVKVYLAKHLEDDLRPPGTELDDYYNEDVSLKQVEKRHPVIEETIESSLQKQSEEQHEFPLKRNSPKVKNSEKSQRRIPRSSRYNNHQSPTRLNSRTSYRYSPHRIRRSSPHRRSPHRRSPIYRAPRSRSPLQKSPQRRIPSWRNHRRRSPSRRSPQGSHRQRLRPSYHERASRRSRSPSNDPIDDNFLYPKQPTIVYPASNIPYSEPGPQFNVLSPSPLVGPPGPVYSGMYDGIYDYGKSSVPSNMSAPQYMTAPAMVPGPPVQPAMNPVMVPVTSEPAPSMVPAPQVLSPFQPMASSNQVVEYKNPYNELAKLYAEGKISKADYLKLAPNKGVSNSMDTHTRVKVLNRCTTLVDKLSKLFLPSHLLVNMKTIGSEQKCLPPKYCSPLKRQPTIEFSFTNQSASMCDQRNKRLVDSIIATLGLESAIPRESKSTKNMKDAEMQTSKPYCDVCSIRENTKTSDASTSTDPEYLSTSVHTQVIEEELLKSRAVFNPSGSISDGSTMSIAHMTPAQLVSQLAARAKTLKQSDQDHAASQGQSSQFSRWYQSNNYGGRGDAGSSGQQYQNYYRY